MTDHRTSNRDEFPDAPERFARALADLAPPPVVVPPAVDDAILREARHRLQPATAGARTILSAGRAPSLRRADRIVRTPKTRFLDRRWWVWLRQVVRPFSIPWARRASWVAATAVLVLSGWLAHRALSPSSAVSAADVNGDGRVDILDALALAQQVERGARLSRMLDFNRDGVVNQRDADAVAMRAVSVTPGEPL